MTEAPIPMSYEQGVALLRETCDSLGGEHRRALEVLRRYAGRGRRPSSMRLEAVSAAASGAQHFVRAQEEIAAGLEQVRKSTHAIALAETEPPPEPVEGES